jgi:hypothetical protein
MSPGIIEQAKKPGFKDLALQGSDSDAPVEILDSRPISGSFVTILVGTSRLRPSAWAKPGDISSNPNEEEMI